MTRIVRLIALALALVAQLPSLLAAAGVCGTLAPGATASALGHRGSHGEHSAPTRDHADHADHPRGHGPEHCGMVSSCASGCVSEGAIVAVHSRAPRLDARLALAVHVPDSPLVSPEPPPPRG